MQQFQIAPAPDFPGWFHVTTDTPGRFFDQFGRILVTVESPTRARMRVFPEERHLNIIETVHGGFLLALADQALFIGSAALEIEQALGGGTIDLSTQFIAPVQAGAPVDAVVDVLRVTGRMIFLRGLIEQAGTIGASFVGTIKKGPRPK